MNKLILTFCFSFFALIGLRAQETFPKTETRTKDVTYTAFTNATIQVDPETRIENATMVIRGGKIISIGKDVYPPENSRVFDLKGKFIYPSFIDLYSDYGMPEVNKKERSPRPQYESKKKGAFGWNEAIHPEMDAANLFRHNADEVDKWRKIGFGTVLSHQMDGIARGTSALVGLGENENHNLLITQAAAQFSFSKGSSQQAYPSSLMGAIALLRQTYYDAQWYETPQNERERNLSLEAFQRSMELPKILNVGNKQELLTADKIGDEFEVQYILVGNGDEYQRIDAVKATEAPLIIPLDFPKPYDVSDPFLSSRVSLEEMKHWEMSPTNPARLEEAEIDFALTSHGLDKPEKFWNNLRKAIEHGLSEKAALEALTTTPAKLIRADDRMGTLEEDKLASFIICSENIFKEDSKIHENWVQGERFVIEPIEALDITGNYNLTFSNQSYPLKVTKEDEKYSATIEILESIEDDVESETDTTEVEVNLNREDRLVSMTFDLKNEKFSGIIRLAGNINSDSRIWDGRGQTATGNWFDWVAVRQVDEPIEVDSLAQDSTKTDSLEIGSLIYPFVAYGWEEKPEQESLWIRNATIWTSDEAGIIEGGQMLVHGGKIVAVGKSLSPSQLLPKEEVEWTQIDARGKHVTPGIIDEHSHIAINRGVNEGSAAVTSEVRIGDAIDSEDINIYRQLAGGVTTSQLLHGSANPIGGQAALIKLRWGLTAEEMKFDSAAPFIKFALGENVKQSNWGDYYRIRFPQSRMGVEQVFYDAFIAASEYGEKWSRYENEMENISRRQRRRGNVPDKPRRDLELEALWEILNSERFITCHSYVQSEINMLMHVGDSMGFTVNTFTHILEGYKLAEQMKEHGAAGSTFSDWWAYKFEVNDAIPYNGALMWEQGVLTGFNSDDPEMARRLNQEAAKAVKYGGVPEEEALKFVTINPAKMLHIDDKIGSLKAGKHADFVIWSDHPLSVYAKAEQTFIDGTRYYDRERENEKNLALERERARLIQKMLGAKKNGEETQEPEEKEEKHYHCDSIHDEGAVGE